MMMNRITITLVGLMIVSVGCSRSTTVTIIAPARSEDVPAAVVADKPIGADDIPTRFYTADGAPIFTPPNQMVQYPVTRRTVRDDGSVITPSDGIRVTGSLSHQDFQAIQSEVRRTEPKHRVHSIRVLDVNKFEVQTLAPPVEGHCPNGQSLQIEKADEGWQVTKTGKWIS